MSNMKNNHPVLRTVRPLVRNGHSMAITIPNKISDLLKLELQQPMQLDVMADGSMVIRPAQGVHVLPSTPALEAPRAIPDLPALRRTARRVAK